MAPRTVYANLPDGLQPFSLWDQSLADMGSLAVIPCTASGSNAITLTPIASVFSPNIVNPPNPNQLFSFVATATSTGAVTVSIVGVTGFLKLYRMDAATQAASGDVQNTVTYVISFGSALNSAAGGFQILAPISNEINPIITGATISNSTLSGCTITTSTYNGNIWTAGTGTLTIAAGKTETFNNTLTFAGTDGTTMTFPATSATLARTDAGNTFTGHQTIEGVTSTGATGTGNLVFSISPTFTTPSLGAATVTTINGLGITTTTGGITIANGKTFVANNSISLSGTDATTMTFPTTTATIARTDAGQTFTGTQNFASLTASSAVATDGSKNLVSVTNTGSGNNVLATSPVLVTPTLGAATATNLTFSPTTGGLAGTTTNDNANAGVVGEYVESNIASGSAVSLTTATPKDVTTISLTAGDWDVEFIAAFTGGATTTITYLEASISTTLNTIDLTNGRFILNFYNGNTPFNTGPGVVGIGGITVRFSLSATTTIHAVVQSVFGTAANNAYGLLRARRMR